MKKKNNDATSNEFKTNFEAKVEAYFENLRGTLRYLPKSERAKFLSREENWLKNAPAHVFGLAAIELLLDAHAPAERVQP